MKSKKRRASRLTLSELNYSNEQSKKNKMGFFSKLTKLALDVAVTPIAVVKDVVTIGGTLTDENDSYTSQKIDDIENDFDELKDSLDD